MSSGAMEELIRLAEQPEILPCNAIESISEALINQCWAFWRLRQNRKYCRPCWSFCQLFCSHRTWQLTAVRNMIYSSWVCWSINPACRPLSPEYHRNPWVNETLAENSREFSHLHESESESKKRKWLKLDSQDSFVVILTRFRTFSLRNCLNTVTTLSTIAGALNTWISLSLWGYPFWKRIDHFYKNVVITKTGTKWCNHFYDYVFHQGTSKLKGLGTDNAEKLEKV